MLPKKLKYCNLFNEGGSYLNQVPSLNLPKLGRKMEGYRGGGMDTEVQIDVGGEPLEMEWTTGGFVDGLLEQWAAPGANAHMLRFAGSYENEDTGAISAVEVVVRGRHQEIDLGEAKVGSDTEHKIKSVLAYYKLTIDGVEKIEIDVLGMVLRVNGVDRLAQHRAAIGV